MHSAEQWIELLLKRSAELRRAGVLSIAAEGFSAVLAAAEPAADPAVAGDDQGESAEVDDPTNPWENPASYPSGHVPSIGDVEPADKLPDIPRFPGES